MARRTNSKKNNRRIPIVLRRLYGNRARTLQDTILSLIPRSTPSTCHCNGRGCLACSSEGFLLRKGDPPGYKKLLKKWFVVVDENAPVVKEYYPDRRWSQRKIVERTIEIIKENAHSASNVLCAGYDQRNHSSPSLELLTTSSWVLLLRRVGDELMVYLLKYTSIFLPSIRGEYSQVAGSSVDDLFSTTNRIEKFKSLKSPLVPGRCTRKRARVGEAKSTPATLNSKCSCCLRLQCLVDVSTEYQVDRRFLFYNRLKSSSAFAGKHILSELKANLSGACVLMKDIFSISGETIGALSGQCSHKTNCCLQNSKCLYHSLLQLLRKLLRNVKRCPHKKLLEKHCPIPSSNQNVDSQSNDIQENALGSDFIAMQCWSSKEQVVSFIWAVCRNIIPPDLFGEKSSWRTLRRNIARFVRLRRFEAFPLSQAMHKLKWSMFPFLSDGHSVCSMNEDVPNCSKLRDNIAKKWIFWFFDMLVLPLLQTHFYITESEHRKQEVFYYRKPIWQKIMRNTATRLENENCYLPVDEASVRTTSRERGFGFSKVRLLPKGSCVRILANLKAKSRLPLKGCNILRGSKNPIFPNKDGFEYFNSVNGVLYDLHAVFKGIQLKEPEKLGASVFNYTDVYNKLCPFLVSLKNGSTSIPTVFIVVADVCKAFDSVNQDKLLDIMEGLLENDDNYILKKSYQVTQKRKYLCVDQDLCLAEKVQGKESYKVSTSSPGVLVNQGWSRKVDRKELLFHLHEHVKRNILKFGSKYYLQGVGIPQGSILSPLLYSFYYGHLEKNVLLPLVQKASAEDLFDHKSVLLRFIDDFLFISTSKEHATSFFSNLSKGFPCYNCTMNEMKFGRNFHIDQTTGNSSANTVYVGDDGILFLRWSGLFINSRTLEIQADYTRFLNIHMSSTLTISWCDNPSLRLKAKLCDYLRHRCHPIFFDTNINSPTVVRLNIYQAFLLCAMKFHCYLCELVNICKVDANSCLLIIENSLRFPHRCLKKWRLFKSLDSRSNFQVEESEVQWLGMMAYIRVLQQKQSRHKELLSKLKSRLTSLEKFMHVSSVLVKAVDDSHSSVFWKIKY